MTGGSDGRSGIGNDGPSADELGGIAFQFAFAILLFLFAGRWVDAKLGTAPWCLMIGVFLGAGLGFYSMYSKLMKIQARDDARRSERAGGR